MVNPESVLAALGLSPETPCDWEPLGEAPGSPVRVFIQGANPLEVLVREAADADARGNHLAVSERLQNAGFRWMPELLAITGEATIERAPRASRSMR